MLLSALREYDVRDYDHEVRAQYPNPTGTPHRHFIKKKRFNLSHKRSHTNMAKSVKGKNEVAEKAAPKKAAEKKKETPTSMGTKEAAKQLGVDPKFFRAVLRQAGKGTDGQRYEWPIGDKLVAERRLLEDYKERQEERKSNAEAKEKKEKSGKAPKKAAKKVAKSKKTDPEEEDELAEEGGEEEVEEME